MMLLFGNDLDSDVFNMSCDVGSSVFFFDVWATSNDISHILEHFLGVKHITVIIHELNESFESSLILDL
jgi:hypothetical protein